MARTSEGIGIKDRGEKLEGNGPDSFCAIGSTGTIGVIPTA